ncbi:MAG: AbrB/MazE/SpoVT family DNA-binding domain-containing protein [Chloroflexi bacterium]|nr:AbrB/MazE/SpoVT family DNA-binding domain-containing protein [Chloroflexota bacterium]
MGTITVQVRRRGTITLPREVRRRYQVEEGDVFTLVDLEDGSFLLRPQVSQLARLADQAARTLAEEGVSLDELLEALEQEREAYYREHFGKA